MKVLIVLAMALAVSSANILHTANPLVQQAFGQIKSNLANNFQAHSRADVHFQHEFVSAMETHVDGVLGEIQTIISAGEAVAQDIGAQLQALARELAELIAAFEANPEADIEAFKAAYAEIMTKIMNILGGGSNLARESVKIPPQVIALIQAILARPAVQEQIKASPLYQCLDKQLEAEGGLNYEYLKELNAQGKLNADYLMNSPAVQHCIREQGGIAAIIANSDIIRRLKELVASLDLTETVYAAIRTVLGETLGNKLIALLQAKNFVAGVTFGIWDDITDGIGGIIGDIGDGLGNLGDKIKDILNSIGNAAGKFKALKELVEKIANADWSNVAQLGKDAAQVLLNAIAPYYCDIGKLAATLVSKLISTYAGLTIPPAIIVAVGGKVVEIITGNPVSCS